jgi:adenylosuccinate synthase
VIGRWTERALHCADAIRIVDEATWKRDLSRHASVIFEGAQGVLLDRDHGFFPHTSPGDCTLRGANTLAAELDLPLKTLGVLRSYTVRHGQGPLPGEMRPRPSWAAESHNADGGWQGAVRASPLDLVLTRYALACVGARLDGLALTHADRVEKAWSFIDAHELPVAGGWERVERVAPFAALTLEARAAETARWLRARAVATSLELASEGPGLDFAQRVADVLGVPLRLLSFGPTSSDVTEIAE